jgi:hypothetical protein
VNKTLTILLVGLAVTIMVLAIASNAHQTHHPPVHGHVLTSQRIDK